MQIENGGLLCKYENIAISQDEISFLAKSPLLFLDQAYRAFIST